MADDEYRTVTTESWGSRMTGSLSGMLFGLLLFIVSFPLLFWNEGRAVDRAKALEVGAEAVVSVSSTAIAPANEGKLVHASGMASTAEVLGDPEFGVSEPAIHLRRKVEMYQWIEEQHSETKEKLGGSTETVTTYSYKKDWSNQAHDSAGFHKPDGHQNPSSLAYPSAEYKAGDVLMGAFRLNESQINDMGREENLPLNGRSLADKIGDRPMSQQGDALYLGKTPSAPTVGDMRVSYTVVKPAVISVVAQQRGDSFVPFETKTGNVMLQEYGDVPAAAMFKSAEESNAMLTWVLRVFGIFVMFLGLRLILAPLRTLAAVVPFIASIVGFGIGAAAFILAIALSLITIAIAWILVRPLLGIALLVVGVVIPVALRYVRKNKIFVPAVKPV